MRAMFSASISAITICSIKYRAMYTNIIVKYIILSFYITIKQILKLSISKYTKIDIESRIIE